MSILIIIKIKCIQYITSFQWRKAELTIIRIVRSLVKRESSCIVYMDFDDVEIFVVLSVYVLSKHKLYSTRDLRAAYMLAPKPAKQRQ